MVRKPFNHLPLWFRFAAITLAILLLFWLPIEDLDERWVVIFAALGCALAAARFFIALDSHHRNAFLVYPLLGTLAGLAVPLVAVFLMAFKGGLHGHPTPDFTSGQVISVLKSTPFWGIGGLLIGIGSSLYDKSYSR